MRVWPISGDDEDSLDASFKDFAVDALQIPDTTVRLTRLASILRVRSSPNVAAYLEV